MEVAQILHMNRGDGETSYYQNSNFQQHVILRARPILEQSIAQLCRKSTAECLKIADLGCSSGPNTLLPLWEMIETVDSTCATSNKKPPLLQVFLNDLPGTDFNTIFGSLVPEFHVKLMEKNKDRTPETCLIGAMPGSFYMKLFPKNSLHFVHSSFAVHWLSQAPEGLVTEDGVALNKGHICLTKTSSPIVWELYSNQFRKDFRKFLELRSEEVISGGAMVLTFITQSAANPYSNFATWELTGLALQDMVNEGKITQFMLDSYNVPLYAPALEDVRKVIEHEGSFGLEGLEEIDVGLDILFGDGNNETVKDKAKHVTKQVRVVAEALMASHFGDDVIEDVFQRLLLRAETFVQRDMALVHFSVISLTKKP